MSRPEAGLKPATTRVTRLDMLRWVILTAIGLYKVGARIVGPAETIGFRGRNEASIDNGWLSPLPPDDAGYHENLEERRAHRSSDENGPRTCGALAVRI